MREMNLYFLILWKIAKLFPHNFVIFNMIRVSREKENVQGDTSAKTY